jgi:hypothetical protein
MNTMKQRLLVLITAFALLGTALVAIPTFADENETSDRGRPQDAGNGRGGHDAQGAREARAEAREERDEAMREARENMTEAMRQGGQAHRECARLAQGNNTTENATGLSIRDCHLQVRDEQKDLRAEAREHFLAAQKRIQAQFQERLHAARDGFLADKGQGQGQGPPDDRGRGCTDRADCIQLNIDRLEMQKNRTESMRSVFEERKAELEERTNMTHPGMEMRLAQLDRALDRIDTQLDRWYGHLAAATATGTAIADETENSEGSEETEETAEEEEEEE